MLPRLSLLDELRKGGYESSLITTFNAYLPFYEEVVLRRLVNAGVRHNVVLMDARQYSDSLSSHPPRLAGRQFTLLPVRVEGAFHPKLMFLAGKQKGLIVVGSHNLTLAGFGFNRELTNCIRIEGGDDTNGINLALQVWDEIEYWLDNYASEIPERVKGMARRVREFAPWLKGKKAAAELGDTMLLAGGPGRRSLWEQFVDLVRGEIDQVSIAGAFLDQETRFLAQVNQDLAPKRLSVAIDPRTVQMPPAARVLKTVSFVRADHLGVDDDASGDTRYLHAKGIYVEQVDGSVVLATGSANPSAPAWLSSASSRNVELMIARRGAEAAAVADSLGFNAISNMLELGEHDWGLIEASAQLPTTQGGAGARAGIGLVEGEQVVLDAGLIAHLKSPVFALLLLDGIERLFQTTMVIEGQKAILGGAASELAAAHALFVYCGDTLALKLWLHHARDAEEHARSGDQRRLKDALISLNTDTPNIALLISCIDSIVFSENQAAEVARLRKAAPTPVRPGTPATEGPHTLAVNLADVRKRGSKHRLHHSSDFGYLLDTLIYHLRVHDDKAIEEQDDLGRSEEEQVGADDDVDTAEARARSEERAALLDLCHRKVGTVIARMNAQLEAFSKGKQRLGEVAIRLLAVLAVLRELRSCDGRVAWVGKGQTSVPVVLREKLLDGVMGHLFERNESDGCSSLLHLDPLGDDFGESDDVARLKGLILWLAWDCGLILDLRKPFNEDREELQKRIHRNAQVVALAQMIQNDDVLLDEARQSIGSVSSGEMNWLAEVRKLSETLHGGRNDVAALSPGDRAEPGDIAIHRTVKDWDLRIVASNGGNQIALLRLSDITNTVSYLPEKLAVLRLS